VSKCWEDGPLLSRASTHDDDLPSDEEAEVSGADVIAMGCGHLDDDY
jgi:hypothetical protein